MKIQYHDAARAIQNWIAKQKLQPGERLPPARLLSEQIGFRQSTTELACNFLIVRRILNRTGYKLILSNPLPASPVNSMVYVVSYWEGFIPIVGRILTERGMKYRGEVLSEFKNKNPIPALSKIFAEKPAGVILWMPQWYDGLETTLQSEKTPIAICADGAPLNVNLNIGGMDLYRGTEKALKYLHDLGHRQIAVLNIFNPTGNDLEITEHYRSICLKLNLKQSASNLWLLPSLTEDIALKTLQKHRKLHPTVTALFTTSVFIRFLPKNFNIPNELSVICLYDFANSEKHKPPITTVGIPTDGKYSSLWACTEIISHIQAIQLERPLPPPHQTLFVPTLTIRGSTKAIPPSDQAPTKARNKIEPKPTRISPWESWRKSYPSLQTGEHQWKQLNLTQFANHSMTKEHGWLGADPLLYFPPGSRLIHGVPFEVIHEKRNQGKSVITFQSPHAHSTGKNQLPISVQLPVDDCVKALYFLHGCGWGENTSFAEYIIHFKTRKTIKIPLIPLGSPQTSTRKRPTSLKPNIQDWWPGFKPQDFPHAMYVTVFNPENPQEYECNLYTLEWINPLPHEEVNFIEVRVDPKAGPTLALIAVTALI